MVSKIYDGVFSLQVVQIHTYLRSVSKLISDCFSQGWRVGSANDG